jgi:site-specific recombinase XerD
MTASDCISGLTADSSLEEGVEAFLEHLEKERNYALHTLDGYRRDLQQFARFLYPRVRDMRLPLRAIQRDVIQSFLEEQEARGRRPRTLARKLAAIRSLFRYFCRERVLAANPAASFESPKDFSPPPTVLGIGAVEEAIKGPSLEGFRGIRDRMILEIFYGAGLLLGELVGLNLSALNKAEGTVQVGGRARIVPLGRKAVETLEVYLQKRADLLVDLDITQVDVGALFLNTRGKRLHRRTVQRLVKVHLEAVSPDVSLSPQLLRRSCATHMLEAGADAGAVRALLGRATETVSQIQTTADPEHLRRIYEKAHPRSS